MLKHRRTPLIFAFMLINAYSLSRSALLLGKIIDSISAGSREFFTKYLIMNVLYVVIIFFSSLIEWRLIFDSIKEATETIKRDLFSVDLVSDAPFEMIDYTTNVDTIYRSKYLSFWNILNLLSTMGFAIFAISELDIKLLVIAFLASLFPIISPLVLTKRINAKAMEFQGRAQSYQAYVAEKLFSRLEVQRYNVHSKILEEYEGINSAHEIARRQVRSLVNLGTIVSGIFGSFAFLIVFGLGGLLALSSSITVGALLSVVQLMNYIVEPVIGIMTFVSELNTAKPIYEKIISKTGAVIPKSKVEGEIGTLNTLKAEHVSFHYENEDRKIIDSFTQEFKRGKKYLISGQSGTGKSTLARILCGELRPTDGRVLLNGRDISEIDSSEIYEVIRYVNQDPVIFTDTIKNNIRFYRDLKDGEVDRISDKLSLGEVNPEDSIKEEELSGGEKLRVSIARSLLEYRGIMIFDEPTSALDEKLAYEIMELLTGLDATVIIISHLNRERVGSYFDEVIEL